MTKRKRFLEIASEFLARVERGERPDPEEYLARHPAHRRALKEFFAAHRLLCREADEDRARRPSSGP